MNKKALLLLLVALALATAWTYKEQEFQPNQIVVYITGTSLQPGAVSIVEKPPELPGGPVDVVVNGKTVKCGYSTFSLDSQASGEVTNGYLSSAAYAKENEYLTVRQKTISKDAFWGTSELVYSLEIAGCAVRYGVGAKIEVGDLSARNGGKLAGHKSHQRGLDVDVALLCGDGNVYPCYDGNKFNVRASWIFVSTLAQKTPVQFIFLDQQLINQLRSYADSTSLDPTLKQEVFSKLLRHEKNHFSHFHVRIHCSTKDSGCTDQRGGFKGTGIEEQIFEDETPDTDIVTSAPLTTTQQCSGVDKMLSSKVDSSMNFMDGLKIFIPGKATCGGIYPVIVTLHGLNKENKFDISMGPGSRGMELIVNQHTSNGGEPVILVEPIDFKPSSDVLWASGFDYSALMNIVRSKLQENNIQISDISVFGHSGAGCSRSNGIYKIIKTEKNLRFVGLSDTCFNTEYGNALKRDLPASTVLISINNGNVASWNPGVREFADFENELGMTSTTCTTSKYSYCKTNSNSNRLSFQVSGTIHGEVPDILLSEILSRIVSGDEALLAKVNPSATDSSRCLLFNPDLNPIISQCSQKYGINENLIKAIIVAESGGYCNNGGGNPNEVSSANAIGLMQLKNGAIQDVNDERSGGDKLTWPQDGYKPSKNICAGAQYLAVLWTRYGASHSINSVEALIHAYNVGPVGYKIGDRNDGYFNNVREKYKTITGNALPSTPNAPGLSVSRKGTPALASI